LFISITIISDVTAPQAQAPNKQIPQVTISFYRFYTYKNWTFQSIRSTLLAQRHHVILTTCSHELPNCNEPCESSCWGCV